jgi:hypothetical protein
VILQTRRYPVKVGLPVLLLAASIVAATYALSRGIYVGSKIYLSPYIRGQYDKDCRYLSFDGILSVQSAGGPTPEATDANGFCPLFHKQLPY